MTPWSVNPRAGWPSSAARAAIASILQAPSSSEYSLWAWRCTAEAALIRPVDHGKRGRRHQRLRRHFCATSGLVQSRDGDQHGDDARAHADDAEHHRFLEGVEAGVHFFLQFTKFRF